MTTIIKQIYEAEPVPSEIRPTSDEYIALTEKMNDEQARMEEHYGRDNLKVLYDYLNTVHAVVDLEKAELFEHGFSMGAGALFEALANCKEKSYEDIR